jgi:hypothetical protein
MAFATVKNMSLFIRFIWAIYLCALNKENGAKKERNPFVYFIIMLGESRCRKGDIVPGLIM